jgi:hypothetical protein
MKGEMGSLRDVLLPLPPGEGWGEGIFNQQMLKMRAHRINPPEYATSIANVLARTRPHPCPLPKGEGA